MGTLIRQNINNLTNGVSEQAPALRLSTQCQNQINCRNSLVEGMGKRFGTSEIGEIAHTNAPESFWESIIRDGREKYQLVIDDVYLKIWNLETGYEYHLDVDPAEAERIEKYFTLKDGKAASKAYQTLQIADTTLILNKTVPVMAKLTDDADGEGEALRQGELYIFSFRSFPWNTDDRSKTYWGGYFGGDPATEIRYYLPNNAQGTVQGNPDSADYIRRSSSFALPDHTRYFPDVGNLIINKLVELYPNDITDAKWEDDRLWVYTTKDFDLQFTNTSWVDFYDVERWAATMSTRMDGWLGRIYKLVIERIMDQQDLTWKDFQDRAYEGIEMTYFELSYGSVNNPDVEIPVVSDAYKQRAEALCYVKQADYKTKYKIVLNGTSCSYTTPEATSSQARAGLATEAIQSNIVTAINTQSATHGVTATIVNNVIHLTAGTDFTMTVQDSLGGFAFKGFKYTTSEFSELPPSAPDGFPLKVIGSAEEDVEPYHVRFNNDGDLASGIWEETVAPGIPQELDKYTLPMRLDRLQDAAYVDADNPFGIYFKLSPASWNNRTVGDQLTAPYPSFVTTTTAGGVVARPRYITAMSLHKNRLAFASNENVVFSAAGDYWNFFRTTVVTILDSDPIDVSVSTNTVTPIEHIMSNMEEMVLFSREQQLVAKAGEVFAADSLEIAPTSQYQTDLAAEPIALNDAIIFVANRSGSISVQELRPSDSGKKVAQELTEHCPTYLQGRARKIEASPSENIMFILPMATDETGETFIPNFMYVYQFQDSGGERVQSAWSMWHFAGQILDITVDGSVLYMVMRYWDDVADEWHTYIEKMELSHDVVLEHSEGVPVRLDRMVVEGEVTDPDPVYTDGRIVVNEGKKFSGYPVIQMWEYRHFFIRDGNEQSKIGGSTQVKSLTLRFNNATKFQTEVWTDGRSEPLTKNFEGRVLGHANNILGETPVVDGEFKIPIMSRGDRATVLIINEHYTDATFLNASWEAFYNDRARGR